MQATECHSAMEESTPCSLVAEPCYRWHYIIIYKPYTKYILFRQAWTSTEERNKNRVKGLLPVNIPVALSEEHKSERYRKYG